MSRDNRSIAGPRVRGARAGAAVGFVTAAILVLVSLLLGGARHPATEVLALCTLTIAGALLGWAWAP